MNETIRNDGYLNRYVIVSPFGNFEGVMTARLRKRVDEINAIAAMEKIKGTKVFKDSVIEAQKREVQDWCHQPARWRITGGHPS